MVPREPSEPLLEASGRIVRPAYLGAAIVYLGLAASHPWLGQADTPLPLTLAVPITGLGLLAAWAFMARRPAPTVHANALMLLLVFIMCLNSTAFLDWARDPMHSTNHILMGFAAGFALSSRAYLAAALSMIFAFWLSVAVAEGLDTPEWRHWSAMIGASNVLAVLLFEARRRALLHEHGLRTLSDERAQVAAQALAEANAANRERLEMQEMMQEALRRESLGSLTGGIAHDFNNLLVAIGGNLELAKGQLDDPKALRECVEEAELATQQAARLTQQMLLYAGRSKPKSEVFSLGERIRDISRMLRSSIPPAISFRLEGTGAGPTVSADGTQFDQVVLNLVQNAVDACTESGGSIEIRWCEMNLSAEALASMRRASSAAPGRFACIEVRDTGVGMDRSVETSMFDPFFTTRGRGSGLGLATVDGIVTAHGGAISVATAPGEGCTVRVLLPLTPGVADDPREETPRARASGAVLVVDDRPEVRRVARRHLEAEGFSVREADGGREALAIIGKHDDWAAALVDLTMPERNGHEVASDLRVLLPELPVVIVSGFDRDDVLAEHASEYPFLAKPFTRNSLLEALSQAIARGGPDPRTG